MTPEYGGGDPWIEQFMFSVEVSHLYQFFHIQFLFLRGGSDVGLVRSAPRCFFHPGPEIINRGFWIRRYSMEGMSWSSTSDFPPNTRKDLFSFHFLLEKNMSTKIITVVFSSRLDAWAPRRSVWSEENINMVEAALNADCVSPSETHCSCWHQQVDVLLKLALMSFYYVYFMDRFIGSNTH